MSHQARESSQAGRLALLVVAALTLWPAAAQANVHVSATGTVVTVTGDDHSNTVVAKAATFGADIIVRQPESITASAPCQVQSPGAVRCLLDAPVSRMVADLPGPLADTFEMSINPAAEDLLWDVDVDFGDSADGIDTALLIAGNNVVDGGPGTRDTVSYRTCCPTGVTARIDGVASGDHLVGIEHVIGSRGPDRLTGRDGPIIENPTFDDTEVIEGGPGDDILEGHGGTDFLNAGDGDDLVLAADGEVDGISCGPGVDRAIVDAIDTHDGSCEVIDLGHDRDGDGLLDEWEEHGFDADGDGTPEVDLPAMGADPDRKDIFVEVDFMTGHRLDEQALGLVIDAFANAPVTSLNGAQSGIALHVDNGANSMMDPVTGEAWGARSNQNEFAHVDVLGTKNGDDYDWSAFDVIKSTGLLVERRPIFHYVVAAHRGPSSFVGISRGIEASDLLLTLGGPGSPEPRRSVDFEADTFMHELGHNLGLRHGGADSINNKPNYLSIMSYGHGGSGLRMVDGTRTIDYSRFTIPLDENALDERQGFGLSAGTPPTEFTTFFHCPDGTTDLAFFDRSINWSCDFDLATAPVAADVNGDQQITELTSQNDWDKLVFDGGVLGNREVPASTPINEPTVEEIAEREAAADAAFAATFAPPSAPPGPPITPTPVLPGLTPPAAPKLSSLRVTPRRLRAARRGPSVVRRGGTKLAYRLDRAASVTFTVERRNGRRWTRLRGSFKHAGKAGANSLRFSGRLASKRLRPGTHRLVATPRGGAAARAPFTVRR